MARNARFLEDIVEDLNVCPYARKARLDGAVFRHVFPDVLDDTGAFASRDALAQVLETLAESDTLEVTQLIFPNAGCDGRMWSRAVKRLTAELQAERGSSVVGVAAFHPELTFRTDSPAVMVPLFRRAPDPTIQWIRLDVLDRVRRGRTNGDVVMPEDTEALLALLRQGKKRSLDEEIADANFRRVNALGVEEFVASLHALRDD